MYVPTGCGESVTVKLPFACVTALSVAGAASLPAWVRVIVTGVPTGGAPTLKVSFPCRVIGWLGAAPDGPAKASCDVSSRGLSMTLREYGPLKGPYTAARIESSADQARPLLARLV